MRSKTILVLAMVLIIDFPAPTLGVEALVLTVDGEPAPDEIWTTEPISLGILLTEGSGVTEFDLIISLFQGDATTALSNLYVIQPNNYWTITWSGADLMLWGNRLETNYPPIMGPTVFIDQLMVEPTNIGGADILIELAVNRNPVRYGNELLYEGVIDTFWLHPIPEPATVLLLALGAMFLRKRR